MISKRSGNRLATFALFGAISLTASPVLAACQNTGNFNNWMSSFKQRAAAQGVQQNTIRTALNGITLDPSVIQADRRQKVFTQSFLKFSGRMIAKYRLQHGAKHLRNKASMFRRIEQTYGVPGPVLVAFWGLETDFGANIGKSKTLRSLATLAYDCRRPAKFEKELISALKIIDSGDLSARQMRGPWAGELGQTQFLPSHYLNYGVDFDGNGRKDLLGSSADALASAANLLANSGWRRGEPWLEEVKVPQNMDWSQAALHIKHPRSQWAAWGVKAYNGKALPNDRLAASLVLPMGHKGPAFLAYENFNRYLEWNQSLTYSLTAAHFAARLSGAPRVSSGRGKVTPLSYDQTKNLQSKLVNAGYDVGKVDGIIGAKTRTAVREMQQRYGLPIDGYPTAELLRKMR